MKTRTLIIIGIIVILVASSSFIALTLQQTSQQCELLGGKIAGLFSCSDKYPTPNNEPKTGSDCRMMFGKGTTEMYDCLEKIEPIPEPESQNQDKSALNNLKCSSNSLGGIICMP